MPLLDEWLWGGVMFMACCSLFWFIANKLHFTQNIPEKSQHSLKTTFIRWIFYVQCRFGEHVTFFQTLESSQFRVEHNSFEQLDSRASQQVKEGKGSESLLGWLTIPPALSFVLASPSTAPAQTCSRGSRSHGASFSGRDLREGGGMGMDPPCAFMTSEVSPEQACLSEICQTVDDLVLPLLFGLTWNSHH